MSNTSILFPNLGITFHHVGRFLLIGDFQIAYYGIVIALGMMIGIEVILKTAKQSGQNEDFYLTLCMTTLVMGVLGARIYYVIFSFDFYRDHLMEILDIRGGGLAIYGGILAGIGTVYLFSRKRKVCFGLLLDTIAPGLLIGQIMGRWGNFFNREAFGGYTDSLLAMALPKEEVYSSDITGEMLDHLLVVDGVEFIQVHPTFLYESLWNLMLLFVVFSLLKRKKYQGQVFLFYLAGYGVGRFLIESLRTDQLLLGNSGIPVSQMLSAVLIFIAFVAGWVLRNKKKTRFSGGDKSFHKI